MKKIISIFLTIIMSFSFYLPVNALENDPDTGELCETFQIEDSKFEYKPVGGYGHGKWNGEIFYMYADIVEIPEGIWGGTDVEYINITPNEGMNVTITRIEAKISGIYYYYGPDFTNVGISNGKKEQTGYIDNGSWVTISDINSKDFSFSGGKDEIAFEIIKVYYICNEHTYDETNHCKACGKQICEATGQHTWNEKGHCDYCDVLKCDVTGEHGPFNETKTPAIIITHNCKYCGEQISEEVVVTNSNTASTFGSGNTLIISGIACVLFAVGGYFVGIKKKNKED